MKVTNIKIRNFRSISSNAHLELNDLQRFNLFIGENNAGKSNIIRIVPFISDILRKIPSLSGSITPSINNSHSSVEDFFNTDKSLDFSISFSFSDDEKEQLLSGFSGENKTFQAELFNNDRNLITLAISVGIENENQLHFNLNELIWNDTPLISTHKKVFRQAVGSFNESQFNDDYGKFSGTRSGKFNYLWVMLNQLKAFHNQMRMIKAVRKIGGTSDKDDGNTASRIINQLDFNGSRVIDMISDWSSPKNSYQQHRKKYKILNQFISDLLDIEVEIVIPNDKSHLLIEPKKDVDGQIMSYKSWGSSVEELIVLVVDILYSPNNSLISLEEPEVHLDPIMQRRLIDFLRDKTDHQYLISSHSSVLINSFTDESSSIYRVFTNNGLTNINKADEKILQSVLDDLGVKASDILQTNGIIWVEGPSDRILINHWINLKDESLKEGIHYSIMFYGGKLLSHLSAQVTADQNEEVSDFINLVKLNRNIAVIIDSDKTKETDKINATKERIRSEINNLSDNAMVWVTQGREIENYVPSETFESILNIQGMSKYTKISNLSTSYIKVDAANQLIKHINKETFEKGTDLNKKINELVKKIHIWNK